MTWHSLFFLLFIFLSSFPFGFWLGPLPTPCLLMWSKFTTISPIPSATLSHLGTRAQSEAKKWIWLPILSKDWAGTKQSTTFLTSVCRLSGGTTGLTQIGFTRSKTTRNIFSQCKTSYSLISLTPSPLFFCMLCQIKMVHLFSSFPWLFICRDVWSASWIGNHPERSPVTQPYHDIEIDIFVGKILAFPLIFIPNRLPTAKVDFFPGLFNWQFPDFGDPNPYDRNFAQQNCGQARSLLPGFRSIWSLVFPARNNRETKYLLQNHHFFSPADKSSLHIFLFGLFWWPALAFPDLRRPHLWWWILPSECAHWVHFLPGNAQHAGLSQNSDRSVLLHHK